MYIGDYFGSKILRVDLGKSELTEAYGGYKEMCSLAPVWDDDASPMKAKNSPSGGMAHPGTRTVNLSIVGGRAGLKK
jgi:hypothetical protein